MVAPYGRLSLARGRCVMSVEKFRTDWRIVAWILALAALALIFRLLSGVLLPFVAGLVLAYLLDPVACRLERAGLNRMGATLLILVGFVLCAGLALVLIAPPLGRQLAGFLASLPDYAARLQSLLLQAGAEFGEKYGGALWSRLGVGGGDPAQFQQPWADLVAQGANAAGVIFRSVWSGGTALIGLVSLLFVTPVVTFYLLLDWRKLLATLDSLIPPGHRGTVHGLTREIDAAMAGFLRGQSLVCLFLGLWYGVGLSLIGLNFGLLIGISGGILTFIPFVGSLTVLVFGLSVAFVQGWPSWTLPLLVLAVVGTGQFLEGNFLTPKLVGASIGLHPVWLIFALLALGSLLGFVGLLIAVPLAAAAGVLLRFAARQYWASPLYHGRGGE